MGFGIPKQLSFLCLASALLKPRVWLFFLTLGVLPTVKDNKRVKFREGPILDGLKKWY